MGIGTSTFLIALGAILKFAVHASLSGISLATIGVILMVAGVAGLVLSFVWANEARRRGAAVDDRPYAVDDRPYVP